MGRIKRDLTNFFKWMALAILTGVVVGGASSVLPYVSGGAMIMDVLLLR